MRRTFTLAELLIVVAVLMQLGILFALLLPAIGGCSSTSDGYRDGYIQKFSTRNGWFCSSREGELALPGFGGSQTGNVWGFYVIDPAVAEQIGKVDATQFVRLHYHESRWAWGHWTNYEVKKLEVRAAR